MKTRPLKIARIAENVLIGRTVYPPRCGSRRGISQQAWIADEQRSEFLVIRRANEYRLISHSAKVLTLVSEDPNLS